MTAAPPTVRTGLPVWGPLVALWLVWGSTYLGVAVMGTSLPPLTANGIRFLLASAILIAVVLVTHGPSGLAITASQGRSIATMGVALLSVGIGVLALAERYVPSGIAALLVAVMPLWIVLFRMRAGDRPARLTLIGVAVGLLGLVLILLPGGSIPVHGTDSDVVVWSLVMMGSCLCWAFFSFRSARYDLPSNALLTTAYEMVVAGVVLFTAGTLLGERIDVGAVAPSAWWALAWLVTASIVGFTAYSWLLRRAPLSLTMTYAYVNPVVAVILGFLILGEALTRDVILGVTVVVGGVALVVTGERR